MSQQERVRYHQYMRPRYTNPTYASSSVSGSLSMPTWFANNSSEVRRQSTNRFQIQNSAGYSYKTNNNIGQIQPPVNPSKDDFNRNKKYHEGYDLPIPRQQQYQTEKQRQTPSQRKQSKNQMKEAYGESRTKSPYEPASRLSNIGNSSLNHFPLINERQIYEKQQSKYNIISIQPKQYNETIKKYPKYHLQNEDVNFYKKLQLENQYARNRDYMRNSRRSSYNRPSQSNYPHENYMKHLPKQNETQHELPNPEPNSIDERQGQHHNYRPKFLNNIDELRGIV